VRALSIDAEVRDARAAGLHHASDERPGIRRLRSGKGFRYVGPDGKPVRDAKTLARIRSIVIPPAWTDVWIAPDALAHVQATGRDARGRKQARYHPRWREVRDRGKYRRIVDFARTLPRLRASVARALREACPSRSCVLATVVRLLDVTLVRVGNDEYAHENHSYGLTTLEDAHVRRRGRVAVLRFRGKGGKEHLVEVEDAAAARMIDRCRRLPGRRLFQYVGEDGARHPVTSDEVNAYLRETARADVTAKDFRTWAGTVLALHALLAAERPANETATKRAINAAIDTVAERLRNTRAVCRRSYVHPDVIGAGEEGTLWSAAVRRLATRSVRGLRREEAVALAFLESRGRAAHRLASGAGRRAAA
jgi:DNA topoisomerase-1